LQDGAVVIEVLVTATVAIGAVIVVTAAVVIVVVGTAEITAKNAILVTVNCERSEAQLAELVIIT
jgi:hypothetical protein